MSTADILIENGLVIDGSGAAAYPASVEITGDRISYVGPERGTQAAKVIDASGLVASPGFIDIHSHSDLTPFFKGYFMDSKLCQGICLEIVGNCGISCLPTNDACRAETKEFVGAGLELPLGDMVLQDDTIVDYKKHVDSVRAATDIGVLIGHGTLRGTVMGFDMRPPTIEELKKMGEALEFELQNGAFGMSLGLIYPPSSYGDLNEFVYLAKILKKYDAILTVHMRSESTKIFEAVDEMLEVARQSQVHLEISHFKLIGKPQWGKATQLLDKIRKAQAEGLEVTCDQYPYLATSTNLAALVPGWAQSGGYEKMCERLADPSEQLLKEIGEEMERRGGSAKILVVSTRNKYPELDGKMLSDIAEAFETAPERAAARLLAELGGGVPCCYFCLDEQDMLQIMAQPFVSVGTDGYSMPLDDSLFKGNPHPRSFGTFPRFFQTVREHQLMPLEKAVEKAAVLPAKVLGLSDWGKVKEGYIASLTIFDPETIEDKSTYLDSKKQPAGIFYVLLKGKLALENGTRIPQNQGTVVLHPLS